MEIDNFELLQEFYLDKTYNGSDDCFLFGQIMVRKKDGSPFARSNNRIIKDLTFRTPDSFSKQKGEIVAICKALGARAYVNVNPRSFKSISIDMAGVCLDLIRTGGEVAVKGAFSTACGRSKPKSSYWIVDVDSHDLEYQQNIAAFLPDDITHVPTVSGCHFLTNGFDSRDFRAAHKDVDIHKNNPTLLYYENGI